MLSYPRSVRRTLWAKVVDLCRVVCYGYEYGDWTGKAMDGALVLLKGVEERTAPMPVYWSEAAGPPCHLAEFERTR